VGEKLRVRGLAASHLSVFVRTNQFNADAKYTGHASMRLSPATSFSPALNQAAQQLLQRCFRPGFRYWKAGVMVDGLLPEGKGEADLFHAGNQVRETRLMAALDTVNQRFGRGTVQRAAMGIKQEWKMRRDNLSPSYTTAWGDLPRVKA
jgi:DNA polymerase V